MRTPKTVRRSSRLRSRAGRLIALVVFLAPGASSQPYTTQALVLPMSASDALGHLVRTLSDDPKALIMAFDPAGGVITIGSIVAGIDLQRSTLQSVPGEHSGGALVFMGGFVRPQGPSSAEIYLHASVVGNAADSRKIRVFNSSGYDERFFYSRLKAGRRPGASSRGRTLNFGATRLWDALEQLQKHGLVHLRLLSREHDIATLIVAGKRLGGYGEDDVFVATLFAEPQPGPRIQLKAHAVVLSPGDCSMKPGKRETASEELLDFIGFAASSGSTSAPETAQGGPPARGFCRMLVDPEPYRPLNELKKKAGKRNFAKSPEEVWAATLLLLRQFALIIASDKTHWRISYTYPCKPSDLRESGKPDETALEKPKGNCGISLWLEARDVGTDAYVAFGEPDGESERGVREIEGLLDRIATRLFAETKFRYLIEAQKK